MTTKLRLSDKVAVDCSRCNGQGNFKHFSHVAEGDCFKCGGSGKTLVTVRTLRRREAQAAADKVAAEAERIAAKTRLPRRIMVRDLLVGDVFVGQWGDHCVVTGMKDLGGDRIRLRSKVVGVITDGPNVYPSDHDFLVISREGAR